MLLYLGFWKTYDYVVHLVYAIYFLFWSNCNHEKYIHFILIVVIHKFSIVG
jgi:hypothetical protein